MRPFKIRTPHLLLLAVLVALFTWYAYEKIVDPSGGSVNDMRWSEEVRLASREILHIQRHIRFSRGRAFGGGWLTSAVYTTSTIDVVGGPKDFITWDAPLIAMLIDRDPETKEWIVVAGHESDAFWFTNGAPCPPQWAFRLRDGAWYVQPVPKSLLGREPNILVDVRLDDDRQYSPADFERVARERKIVQTSAIPQRIGRDLARVGAVSEYFLPHCKPDVPPGFTSKFPLPNDHSEPDLTRFPRM
jgi:hypothetical protein